MIDFYERCVNGNGLSRWQLVANKAPGRSHFAISPNNPQPPQNVHILSLQPFDLSSVPLTRVSLAAPSPIYQIIVHGSQATRDSNEFSDVDMLIVLDDTKDYSYKDHRHAVSELQRLLASAYAFDPLMHHGFMFVLRSSFAHYDQSPLPLATLQRANVLYGPDTVEVVAVQPVQARLRERFIRALSSVSRQVEVRNFMQGDHQLKSFISGVLLLPAIFLQARGEFVYKRESFRIAASFFSKAEWQFIAAAEEVRRTWNRPPRRLVQEWATRFMHPRSRIVFAERWPTRINVNNQSVRSALKELENATSLFAVRAREALV